MEKTELIQKDGQSFYVHYGIPISLDLESKVTAFYSYTSVVRNSFIRVEYSHNDIFNKFRDDLILSARKNGIKAHLDNKTVFEITQKNGSKIYIGFYDCVMRIGTGVWTEYPENEKRPINKKEE